MNTLRVISWNLLRLVGASTGDVAALIAQYQPDLLLMQEAGRELGALPGMVGGHVVHTPLQDRIYGLAVWSKVALPPPEVLPLPVSTMPGRVPLRSAQIVRLGGIRFANVHLSHGQFLNRWQLLHLVRELEGPAAIVGDYNAVGPIRLAGLRDVGPREPTHVAGRLIPFRLDRCMVRGLVCGDAQVLERGSSDHRPIMVSLRVAAAWLPPPWRDAAAEYASLADELVPIGSADASLAARGADTRVRANLADAPLPANLRRWLRSLTQQEISFAGSQPGGAGPEMIRGRRASRRRRLAMVHGLLQRGIRGREQNKQGH